MRVQNTLHRVAKKGRADGRSEGVAGVHVRVGERGRAGRGSRER